MLPCSRRSGLDASAIVEVLNTTKNKNNLISLIELNVKQDYSSVSDTEYVYFLYINHFWVFALKYIVASALSTLILL